MADKYMTVLLIQLKNLAQYRTNLLLKLIRPLIMTFAIGSLWVVLFAVTGREEIGGFTMLSFIVYLLIVRFVAVFSPGGASIAEMNEEIRTGNIAMRLVRPIHYMRYLFFRNVPVPFVSGLIGLTIIALLAVIATPHYPTGWMIPLFMIAVLITITVQYAIYQGLGILSFWVYEIWSLERLYNSLRSILSGELIPLTLFGGMLQQVLQVLPFAALAFIPGGIFIGLFTVEQAMFLLAVQAGWAIVLWLAVVFLFKKGLEKFEAQGG